MLVKMCDLDTVKHCEGISNDGVKKQLRKHDEQFGLLLEAVRRFWDFDETNFVILGDHGQSDIEKNINFNLLLKENGFITTDENNHMIIRLTVIQPVCLPGLILRIKMMKS